jgi:hypothetical protein
VNQSNPGPRRLPLPVALLLLLVRGLLLWLVVPVTFVGWLAAWPILRRRKIRLGQLLGWMDLNLIAAIEHSILRPLLASPFPWTPAKELPNISHRIGLLDPV